MHNQKKHSARPKSIKKQQGVVIIIALFFVALVATIAYSMVTRLDRDINRTDLILTAAQADFYAQGSVAWAMDTLRMNLLHQKPNKLVDSLPIELAENSINGYRIQTSIKDLQGRFNINSLQVTSDPQKALIKQESFIALLHAVLPDIADQTARDITAAISDWLSPLTENNEQKFAYDQLPVPYRAAHRLMQSVSELRLVKGVTSEIFNRLKDYLCALPNDENIINIQTAPVPVLTSISPDLKLMGANLIADIRKNQEITNIETWVNMEKLSSYTIPKDRITLLSQYFLIETTISINEQHLVLYTMVERKSKEANAQVNIIWQSKNIIG